MTRWSTSHFVDFEAAVRYYRVYSDGSYDFVQRKIDKGEIHLGPPELKPGETFSVIPHEGRYQITVEDAAP